MKYVLSWNVKMDFMHKARTRLALIVSVLSLTACGVSPTEPTIYYKPKNTYSSLPAHADTEHVSESMLSALRVRNLTATTGFHVLPYRSGRCKASLLYSVTPANMSGLFLNGKDLFSGAYLVLSYDDGDWELTNSRSRTSNIKSISAEDAIEDNLDALRQYELYVRLSGNLDEDALEDLTEIFVENGMTMPAVIVANSRYHKLIKQSALSSSRLYFDAPAAIEGASFIASTPQQNDVDLIYSYSGNGASNNALQLKNIILESNFNKACNAKGTFVSQPKLNLLAKKRFSDEELVLGLPADADFNQLPVQHKLIAQGKYLNWLGENKAYTLSEKTKDKCLEKNATQDVLARCAARKRDADSVMQDEKVVFGW